MPKLIRPTSDNDRLQLLQRSLRAGIKDAEAGRPRLAPPTLTRLTKLTACFDGTLRAAVDAEAAWRAAAQQATGARAALEVEIRTIWQRLRVQSRRQLIAPQVLTYYGLDQRGRLPAYPKRHDDWLLLAQQLLQGDTEAQAAGHPPQLNRDELQRLYDEAQVVTTALNQALLDHQATRKQLRADRDTVQAQIRAVVSELRHALHADTPSHRREVMRAYGLLFQQELPRTTDDEATPNGYEPPVSTAMPTNGYHESAVDGEPIYVAGG